MKGNFRGLKWNILSKGRNIPTQGLERKMDMAEVVSVSKKVVGTE